MRVPSAEHVNLTAIHLHGWSIGWKVYTRKKQLGSRVEEDASRRADRQINIGRSRFIVMHPRYCVSKTLYVYPSAGVCTCTRLHARNSKAANRSARGWREGSGIETEEKKEETKLGEGKGRNETKAINSVDYLVGRRHGRFPPSLFLSSSRQEKFS